MTTAVQKSRVGVISTVVLALVAGLLVWVATRSEGEVVRKADLNDGGVWVTNAAEARYGRINKAAGQLDAGVLSDGTPGSGLDIFQDGAAVIGLSTATQQIVPINSAEGSIATQQSVALAKAAPTTGQTVFTAPLVDLRGRTVATIDATSGAVRAMRVDNRSGINSLDQLQTQAKPRATVGRNASVAVGVDGTVYALSAEKGVLAVIRPEGQTFAKPVEIKLGFTSKSAQVTAVGSHYVVWDAATNLLYSEGLEQPEKISVGQGDQGSVAYAALQQPGPAAEHVLVQDEAQLVQVPIVDDARDATGVKLAQVPPGGDGPTLLLSAPVRVGNCVHAAWTGPANVYYGRNCGAPQDAKTVDLGATKKGTRSEGAKLRVNRGLVVLNDLDSGDVWDIDRDRVKIDNWNSVIPPPQVDKKNPKKDDNLADDSNRQPPKAQPDQFQVRPGRTSTLHVLDNDTDALGAILAISPGDITKPGVDGITASASSDGQTVQVTVPDEPGANLFTFDYTVNNGTTAKTGRATAKVTVKVVGPDVNSAPRLRGGQAKLATTPYPVVAGGTVKVGVIADWRDAECDPLQISPATPATVGVDGAGALTIKAGPKPGKKSVEFTVSDSQGQSTDSAVPIQVLSPKDRAVAPRSQPDVLRGVVGKPIQVQPLGNDVPGADPSDPDARLRLATGVRGPGQLTIDTNLDTNVLTVTGATPGTSIITYAARSGSAVSPGRVRVDILPDPAKELPPVAAPDGAVLRGQLPVIADVLSNDYSPRSDVIVVQRVQTTNAWLRTSVVQGRWVRVEATAPLSGDKERRGVVKYTISDGTKTAEGELSITQKPQPKEPIRPTAIDDSAAVRVGDAVTIPVLDNDSMTEGIPLKLDPNGVRVITGGGQAFASGSVVRYVPDQKSAAAKAPQVAVLEYSVHPEGLRARSVSARITVTINPLPSATRPNQAPTARSFSASVTAGDTLTITIPTSGVDPDGDLTFVGGIVGEAGGAVNLEHGRVLGFGAATIRYEAYPRSAGTEVIRYQLRDRFGLTSQGFVRVGVVQPGDPQPPVAVEDDVVAAPGRTVQVDLLANDLISSDDSVEFEDFTALNEPDVLADFKKQKDQSFKVVTPPEGPAKVLAYGITNGLFDPSRSTLTVRGQKDFNNPPVAVDDTGVAKPGETTILVDALANDRDLDGQRSTLSIKRVVGDQAVIERGKVRVTLRPEARVVPYVIEDADGAVAMAVIYVPAGNNGLPFVIPDKPIKMAANSTVNVKLSDYVTDPRNSTNGTIAMTSPDTISTAPSANLQYAADTATAVTLTSTQDYVGPAALMLEITNAKAPGDKSAATTYVTIPVQIGPDAPVLRCPDYEITVVANGPERKFDIPRFCHAWLPTGMPQSAAAYEATWDPAIDDVTLTQANGGGRTVAVKAALSAVGGATGAIAIKAKGSPEVFKVGVKVIGAPQQKSDDPADPAAPPVPLATLRPMSIEGLIAGTSASINVAQYLDSALPGKTCSITSSQLNSGAGVSATAAGCQLTVSATAEARGEARLLVQAVDGPDRGPALGEVVITLRGKPDPMEAPTAIADRVAGGTARVDFVQPLYDGGMPILEYEVTTIGPGGTAVACTASPCTITGLTNGQDYTFTVRSRNAVGWSDPSPPSSPPVRPDTLPQATSISNIVPGDRQLNVSWTEPTNEGSAITEYEVNWVNVGSQAGQSQTAKVAAPEMSKVLAGLINNDAYNIRVHAANELGYGPYGPEVQAQSFGTPTAVAAPSLTPRSPAPDQDNAQVTITWPTTNPNGPPITKYEVFRRQSGGAWTLIATVSGGDQRVASDTIPYNGQVVHYVVTATNGGPATSEKSNFSSYKADGIPETPRLNDVTNPAPNYSASASFTLGNPRGQGYDRVEWQSIRDSDRRAGSWACGSGCSGGTATGLSVLAQLMSIRACNVAGHCSPWSNPAAHHPYGPTNDVGSIRVTNGDGGVTFNWDRPAYNGNNIGGYRVSKLSDAGQGCNRTFGPDETACTVGGLTWDTAARISITPFADRSGDGPTSTASGRTNPAPPPPPPPPPKVEGVGHGGSAQGQDGCGSQWCRYIAYNLSGFTGNIVCYFNSSDGAWANPDDGAGGRHNPVNGSNVSTKYFGYEKGWVEVRCSGANGSDSFTRSPWF